MVKYRYVPFLRTKSGEVGALQHLTVAARARIFPVFHLVQAPPANFLGGLLQAVPGMPLALDGLYNLATNGTPAAFVSMFNGLGQGGMPVIPSVECDAPATYMTALRPLVGRYAPGLVVKATLAQLATVQNWVVAQSWQPSLVDLCIVAGHAADFAPPLFQSLVLNTLTTAFPSPAAWRSVTLAASAAPRDYSSLPTGRTLVPRLDWLLWSTIVPRLPQPLLHYGDYGVSHPDLTEPPGVAMVRATVSVRYAISADWIFLKGVATSGPTGRQMGAQYAAHARTLVNDQQFGGVPGCWADQRIQQIAAGSSTPGNRATWVTLNVNRHLSLVAHQLP